MVKNQQKSTLKTNTEAHIRKKNYLLMVFFIGILCITLVLATDYSIVLLRDVLGTSTTDNNINNIGAAAWTAYNFTATANYSLRIVQIYVSEDGGLANPTHVGLYAVDSTTNQVIDTLIGENSSTISSFVVDTYYNFTFSAANTTNVTVGKKYALVFWDTVLGGSVIRLGETTAVGGKSFIQGGPLSSLDFDSASNVESVNIRIFGANFTLTEEPSGVNVFLTLPADASSISVSNATIFKANYTGTAITLKNATYDIRYTNGTIFNITTYDINSTNITLRQFTTNFGNYVWNVLACGENATTMICNWQDNNFTFEAGAEILGQSFPGNVSETESATFTLNISLISGANLFAARLNYNGTRYLGTKTLTDTTRFVLSRTIDIPIIPNGIAQNISFLWEFEYKNGLQGSQNSSTFSHKVNPLTFSLCNVTHTNMIWNITTANETTRKATLSSLDGSFEYWLGSGTVTREYSLDSPDANTRSNYTFCGNRDNVNVSAVINVKSTGFFERTFYFNKQLLNSSITNTTLFLLDQGSAIILQVTDPGLVAQVGIFINVFRFYPEINKYLIIEKAKTDEFGQFVARLIEPNTVKYQFEFLNADNKVLKKTDDMTIACRTDFCVIPFVIEDTSDDFSRFENVIDFDYSLGWDNSTTTFTYTWNDVTGDSITSRLLVQRIQFNGTTTICNSTSTSLANTMTCDVGGSKAKYRTQAFRQVSGEDEQRVAILNIEVGSAAAIFGLEGLFWAFILLFTLVGVGSFNPSIGVGLYTVGFIGLGVFGIISMPIGIFFANLILGVIFIWAIRT